MAPATRVLDFYGLPSLFVIDCEQENHGVRILASQGLKDQCEWDELRREIIQQLKSHQCPTQARQPHTLLPRSPDTLYSPNPPIGNQTEDLPRSHSSSQACLNASVASWRSGVQHMTNFRMPRLPATNGGVTLHHHTAATSEATSTGRQSKKRTMGTGSSLTTDKPSVKTSSWTELLSRSCSGVWQTVHFKRQWNTEGLLKLTLRWYQPQAPSSHELPYLSLCRFSAHHVGYTPVDELDMQALQLPSISNRSSTQLSDADVRAISTLWLSDALSADDISQVLRSQFHISEEFFSDYGSINATQNQPEKQDPKVTKETYNRRIQELKRKFEEDVNVIANEFSGRHVHRSAAQIRGQILYTMAEDKKTRSPHISNAWAHATADVGRLDTESFTDMPYDTAYMDLLRDIKVGVVTQEDVGDPQTPEDEYNHKLLLDAVLVSRQHRTAKRHIISPELSAHRLALHAKDQLQKMATRIHETCGIEVLIMMTKSWVEDVFTPYVWATPRAKEYWVVGAAQNMTSCAQEMEGFCISNIRGMAKVAEETIKELRTRLAGLTTDRLHLPGSAAKDKFVGMKWEKEGYLQLVSGLKLKIDSYPFDEIKAPKWLRKAELMKLIEGWEHGSIKWVTASNDEIKSAQQELSRLAREKVDRTVNRRQSATNKANSSTSTPDISETVLLSVGHGQSGVALNSSPALPSGRAASTTRGRKRTATDLQDAPEFID
ncbi:uncharacterized protein EI90DRAFT_3012843 [Cantharellus anzutake]|uniref:uncharacterized protein n=1 Tax=Cantharellus anzutake TaxID=1750568 RepID=UPI001903C355|nr:uncharacterized protein EI90DRAFT_3012843 [Cantharellus anzutake]KAF8339939.1 hypothetical protein EI90DRAFT_3012843 [Cantharellus anzutake]